MSEKNIEKLDYKKLGMISGIEIHQQLDTKKLFCNCPSHIRDDKPDLFVRRKLKAVVGETGKVDAAALHASTLDREMIYRGYSDTNCPFEFDEEPPRPMNKEAVNVVLQTCKLLNSKIVDEVQVMRKTVVDGSNTSGFQRTGMVGYDGLMELSFGKVRVPSIILEEDSAKIIEQTSKKAEFNLSRLGIPLIEITTEPDMSNPEEVKEAALRLGLVLRSTGKAKRGLGTIRQDLNVSIRDGSSQGNRVEIKGAQDLRMITTWVENEVRRQVSLYKIRDELTSKKAKVNSDVFDITKIFDKTECKIIAGALKKKGVVKAIKLSGFNSYVGYEIQPNKRLGTEFSDYGKVSSSVKGLIHSDEKLIEKYTLSESEVKAIKKELDVKSNDAFIMIADLEEEVDNALAAVIRRANMVFDGVIAEVRRANPDGTTTFMRPMPGAARMYPETDCLPVQTKSYLENIQIPEFLLDKEARYQKEYSLTENIAVNVSRFNYGVMQEYNSFDEIISDFKKTKPLYLAETIIGTPKELKKRFNLEDSEHIYTHLFFLLKKIEDGEITKSILLDVLAELVQGKEVDFSKYKGVSDEELETELKAIIDKNKGAPMGALMGQAMAKFRGKVEGKKISEMLRKLAN